MLGAGGTLTLSALLAACSQSQDQPRAAPRTTTSAPPTTTTPPPPPPPSPVDLLDAAGTCTLTPETIAGPTWFDAHAVRSDIVDGRPGTPLALAFRVVQADGCTPLSGAVVDLWQADAGGIYSGFAGASPGQGGHAGGSDEYGDRQSAATDADRYLRGTQVTGADGVVRFDTIYPGWYPTRTPHLHLKVHLAEATVRTTQLFFDDAVSDGVLAADPYSAEGSRDTRNDTDSFYKPAAQLRLAADGARWLGALVLGVPS